MLFYNENIYSITATLLNAAICLKVYLLIKEATGFRGALLGIRQGCCVYTVGSSVPGQSLKNNFLIIYLIQCNRFDELWVESHCNFEMCHRGWCVLSSCLCLHPSLFGELICKYLSMLGLVGQNTADCVNNRNLFSHTSHITGGWVAQDRVSLLGLSSLCLLCGSSHGWGRKRERERVG